ncbi:MAG: sugar transferase [Candidatus Eisenbacteria bacterium]
MEGSSRNVRILGFASPERPSAGPLRPHYQSRLEDLPSLAAEINADLVVVAQPNLPRDEAILLSDALVASGRRVHVVSNVFNQLVDSLPFETDHGVPLVPLGHTPLRDVEASAKRVFDLVGTVIGGIVISPILIVIAVLVKLSSPGPVLFTQERMGKDGRIFSFYKFRTMAVQNDDSAHRAYVTELMTGGDAAAVDKDGKPLFKLVDDPRITRIGRFLRRTSLDELPQLINVLRGEMSLIGPRPCLPFEFDLYKDWQKRRLDVTPGMTGLWQVTGRSYVSFEDMVLLDLFYIANWSFAMDLRILLRTVPVVIWGKGGV